MSFQSFNYSFCADSILPKRGETTRESWCRNGTNSALKEVFLFLMHVDATGQTGQLKVLHDLKETAAAGNFGSL